MTFLCLDFGTNLTVVLIFPQEDSRNVAQTYFCLQVVRLTSVSRGYSLSTRGKNRSLGPPQFCVFFIFCEL